jgi:hypothetical protein
MNVVCTSDPYYQSSHELLISTQKYWEMEEHITQKHHFLSRSVYICFMYYFTLCHLNLKVTASFGPNLSLTQHLILRIFCRLTFNLQVTNM